MRHIRLISSFLAALAVLWSPAFAASPEVNALWNDKYGFGLWLYDAPRSCSGKSAYSAPFINVGPGGRHESFKGKTLDNTGIALCASFGPRSQVSGTCVVHRLDLKFDQALNQFFGSYELTLSSGKKLQGEYRAEFCAPD